MQHQDIDWNEMWRQCCRQKSWPKKDQTAWDKRAASYAKRQIGGSYTHRLLEMMAPEVEWTVLDVGCGPGTIALPLARQVKKITALDFSGEMLKELKLRLAEEKINNVETRQLSWTDDWQAAGILPHDVTLASRSMSVTDLGRALEKLDNWATKKVFISDRVGSGPFDPDLFSALGRSFEPGPDYIFTINILYRMGIHPRVDYILFPQDKIFNNREEAIQSCLWMAEELTEAEKPKLERYVDERLRKNPDGSVTLTRRTPVKWAIISWDKNQHKSP